MKCNSHTVVIDSGHAYQPHYHLCSGVVTATENSQKTFKCLKATKSKASFIIEHKQNYLFSAYNRPSQGNESVKSHVVDTVPSVTGSIGIFLSFLCEAVL